MPRAHDWKIAYRWESGTQGTASFKHKFDLIHIARSILAEAKTTGQKVDIKLWNNRTGEVLPLPDITQD